MANYYGLIKESNAFNLIRREKLEGKLSHAYLFITPDYLSIKEYLKALAKVVACETDQPCNECRNCRLIDNQTHPDVLFYPKTDSEKILAEDVKDIISECYVKPLECNKKIFIIPRLDLMDERTQNKLLKILEEPPRNVCFLLGTASASAILLTVRSRVKQVEINSFTREQLFNALKLDCPDTQKLERAIITSDYTLGRVLTLYDNTSFKTTCDMIFNTLKYMYSSKDVLEFADSFSKIKELDELINTFILIFSDLLRYYEGGENAVMVKDWIKEYQQLSNYNTGSIIYILDSLEQAKTRVKFNANQTMLIDWLLFKILEGKYKWQKL